MISGNATDLQKKLTEAVRLNDAKEVESLLKQGAKVSNDVVYSKWTLLDFAVSNKNAKIISLLLGSGLNYQTNYEALRRVIKNGLEECLTEFLKHVSTVNPITSRAFGFAFLDTLTDQYSSDNAQGKQLYAKLAKKLLDAGVTVNFCYTDTHENALHLAVLNKDSDMIKSLIAANVDANHKNNQGETPMDLAKKSGIPTIIQLFPALKTETEMKSLQEAFISAVKNNKLDIAKQLLEAGVKIPSNAILLHYVIYSNNLSMLTLLLKHGANHEELSGDKETPIRFAYRINNLRSLRVFLSFPEIAKSASMGVMLSSLISSGEKRLAIEFIDKGVPVNSLDQHLDSPLHAAVRKKYDDVIQLLLLHGADPYQKNDLSHSAVDLAVKMNYWSAITLFAEHAKTTCSSKKLTDVEIALLEKDYERVVRLFNEGHMVSRGLTALSYNQAHAIPEYKGKCPEDGPFQKYMATYLQEYSSKIVNDFKSLFEEIQAGHFSDSDLQRFGRTDSFKSRLGFYIYSLPKQQQFDIFHESINNSDNPIYKIWNTQRGLIKPRITKGFLKHAADIVAQLKQEGYQLSTPKEAIKPSAPVAISIPAASAPSALLDVSELAAPDAKQSESVPQVEEPPVVAEQHQEQPARPSLYPQVVAGVPNTLFAAPAALAPVEPIPEKKLALELVAIPRPVSPVPTKELPKIESEQVRLFGNKKARRKAKKATQKERMEPRSALVPA